jgi:LuxR family maltose regulon positive regulatory protein
MSTGDVEGVEARLQDAERCLDATGNPTTDVVVRDDLGLRRLPGQIAMYRAGQALIGGDVAASMTHARRALDLAGPDDHLGRGGPSALLGLAYWTVGDLGSAYRWYADGMAALAEGGFSSDVIGGAITLADILVVQGRLREALSSYRRGLRRAEETVPPLRGAADMHVGISELLVERNDLAAAEDHLRRCQELGEHAGLPKNPYRRRVAMARIRQLRGDVDGALVLLDEAERRYNSDYSPDVRPIPAVRARLCVACGRLADALDWMQQRGPSEDDDVRYVREYEDITVARVLLAQGSAERAGPPLREAGALLRRLLHAAEEGGRTGSVIEILILQALTARALGDVPAAFGPLERALSLAEPEGYVRTFVDEGPPMAALLRALATGGPATAYAGRLLAAFAAPPDAIPLQRGVVEPLSVRELEVLRLLGTDLDGPAIARRLFLSLNTVRTHTRNIYAKLGVNSRRAAVRRAAELHLLPALRG